jgi:ABC-2 type transport system ATP-binding protein
VPAEQVATITARLLAELPVQDLTIEDPPIEDVIERAFQE